MSYVFKQELLPAAKRRLKSPYAMMPQYVTVHNTANDASAANEVAYHNRNNNQVSFHVAVDDKEVIQCIPFNRTAWHCGDGNGKGNMNSIGIEICYSKSGGAKYVAAEENTVQYLAHLLHSFGWGIEKVKQHYDWSRKNCPHRIRDEKRWDTFIERVQSALIEIKNPSEKEESKVYSSQSLKTEHETTRSSAARRKIIVEAAVTAGYNKSWLDKLENGKVTADDVDALAAGTLIKMHK